MVRIHGIDIPDNKKIEFALRYIYGIGATYSKNILKYANINGNKRSNTLEQEELKKLTEAIIKLNYTVEGDLRREIYANKKRLIAIKSYRGIRHIKGLPVNGQRTKTNAKTRKKLKKTGKNKN